MLNYRRERFRLYPTPEQVARLEAWEHSLRWLWNNAHTERVAKLNHGYVMPTAFDQIRGLTALRASVPWLADLPRDVSGQLLIHIDKAWQRGFAKLANMPCYKSRSRGDKAPMVASRDFRVEGTGRWGAVVFPKLGKVRAVIHRPIVGKAKQCSIIRDGEQWFVSIACEREIADPAPSTNPAVAIDRGIALLLADSDGRITENPRHAAVLQPRIVRAQRASARKKKGSNNQKKANAKVARLQRRVRRQREHALHVASHRYAKNHGTVIVEALNIKSMTRSAKGTVAEPGVNVAQKRGLNREIQSAGWGRFVRMLRYKVIPEGGQVVEVPPAYSSQTCAECGVVDAGSRRSQASFVCTACGHTDNADVNAARVLLARGLKKIAVEATVTVCGGIGARGRPVKQKLRVVRRGTRSTAAVQASVVGAG